MSEPSEFLLQNLSAIQQIITTICRRKGVEADEIEEFAAVVRLRLVENDYSIVRAFQGRSSFNTYIAAVITRMLVDYRRHEWGKWRDSAGAERLGDAAVELERLLHRDGRPLEDALALVAPRHPELTRSELMELAAELAPRSRRRMVALEEAAQVSVENDAERAERAETAARISHIVRAFLKDLPGEDQLILKLRFDSEMTVAQISRSLHLAYQGLWRRLQDHYRDLRQQLEGAGIAVSDVEKLVGSEVLLDFRIKNYGSRPSEDAESGVAARQEDISS